MPYGLANRHGQTSEPGVREILSVALAAGVDLLDTARAYGSSESVIGALPKTLTQPFRIVTKLSPDVWRFGISAADAAGRAQRSVGDSLDALGADAIDTLLLHRAEQRTCCDGAVWRFLREARDCGTIGSLGVSAGDPDEAFEAIEDPDVQVVQVAASLLDQRLVRRGFFDAASESGKEVHVRSVYLQGLAFLDTRDLPTHLRPAKAQIDRIRDSARQQGIESGELWLQYARTLPVDRLILGAETAAQVGSNLRVFDRPIPPSVADLAAELELLPDSILDPARW